MRPQPHPLVAVAVALAFVAGGCGGQNSDSPTKATETTTSAGESVVVDFVNDGDTLRTTSGKKVRLLQIDAPELHGDCYGKAALTALKLLAPKGTHITLVRDPALDQTDRYGRQLRYAFVNGTNINVALVRGGAASPVLLPQREGAATRSSCSQRSRRLARGVSATGARARTRS